MRRRTFISSLLSLSMVSVISRATQPEDVSLWGEPALREQPLGRMQENLRSWQVAVDYESRFEQLCRGKLPWPDASIVEWYRDDLQQHYYFTLPTRNRYWDQRSLKLQDITWAINRAQQSLSGVPRQKNLWYSLPTFIKKSDNNFAVAFSDCPHEYANMIPMLIAALFEQS